MFRVSQSNRDFYSKPKDLLWILASILVLYVFICTFPLVYEPLGTGLDQSWQFALNSLPGSKDYSFGRDVNFNYGPLGYLLAARLVPGGVNPIVAGIFWLAIDVSMFTIVCLRFRNHLRTLALFCTFYLCVCALGLWSEYKVVFIVCVLCLSSLENSYTSIASAALASSLTALTPETKWSLALASVSFLVGSWVLLWIQKTKRARTTLVVGAATFSVVLLMLQLVLFRTVADWTKWLAASFEITRGYSSGMSITGENTPLILALLASTTLFCLFFILTPTTRQCLYLFVPISLIAFKEGFVRQDGHRSIFFLVVAMTPILLLLSPILSRRDRSRLTAAFALSYGFAIWYSSHFPAFPAFQAQEIANFMRMNSGFQNLYAVLRLPETVAGMRVASNEGLKPDILPSEWRTTIGQASVSILPWEISIAAANHLNWRPLPTLQLYTAYTGPLDRITADAIQIHGADYLIVDFLEIDGRNVVLDDPLTWRSIMQNYQVSILDPSSQRLLLSRRSSVVLPMQLETVSKRRDAFDTWVDVPKESHLLYAALRLENSAIGRLAEMFYQVPGVYLQLQRVSGRRSIHRILPKTAQNGMLINFVPETGFDLSQLVQGYALDPVTRFLITDSTAGPFFKRHYDWELLAETGASVAPGKGREPPLVTEVTPSTGNGREAALEITTESSGGINNLGFVQVLVNGNLDGVRSCYLNYEIPQNRLWLIADEGHGTAGVGQPGDQRVLENSQCRIALDRAKPYRVGNAVKLKFEIEFRAAFAGKRHIFVYAKDQSGLISDWRSRAEWQVN